jgi:MYXO-CTERM domain-containing protein
VETGTAGAGTTGAGGGGTPGQASGGCSCDTAAGAPPAATTVLGLLLGVVMFARRRSRRASPMAD